MSLENIDSVKLRVLWAISQLNGRANLSGLMKKGGFCVGMLINNVNVLIEKGMVKTSLQNPNTYIITKKGLEILKKYTENEE